MKFVQLKEPMDLRTNSCVTDTQVESYNKLGIHITRLFIGRKPSPFEVTFFVNMYIFEVNGESFEFTDSIYNFRKGVQPTAYDFIERLTKDDPGNFDDFCENYGYENDSIHVFKIYQDVIEEWHKVRRAFNSQEKLDFIRGIDFNYRI